MRGKRAVTVAAMGAAVGAAYVAYRWRRITKDEVERLASLLGWEPGRAVADVGAGRGRMAIRASRRVGAAGRVFAAEVDPKKVQAIHKKAAKRRLDNLTVLHAREDDTGLPAGCCDAILLRGSYHHFTDPRSVNASLYRALRPGGVLLALDFAPRRWLTAIAPLKGVPANRGGHGIPPEVLMQELKEAGFEVDRSLPRWFWDVYGVVFRKPAEAA